MTVHHMGGKVHAHLPYLCASLGNVVDDISLLDMLAIPLELNVVLDAATTSSNMTIKIETMKMLTCTTPFEFSL